MTSRSNNFDTIRFFAALAVLWSHAFSATTGMGLSQPLVALSENQTTLGTVGVAAFFVISGYLITRSFEQTPSVWRFAKARVVRLVPALIIVVLLSAFVMGPIVTAVPLEEYFSSWELYRYVVVNGSMTGYQGDLPGVFLDNPSNSVNSPLWTLPYEVECYGLVFTLGILGLLNRYVTLAILAAGLTFLSIDGPYTIDEFRDWNHRVNLVTTFFGGAAIYHWRLGLTAVRAVACAALSLLTLLYGGFWLALPTCFAYLVIYVALGPIKLPDMARYGDLSYGIYIYGWPVKQLLIHYAVATGWFEVAMWATVIVIGLAALSWHVVEKNALALKDYNVPGEERVSGYFDGATAALRSAVARWLTIFRLSMLRGLATSPAKNRSNG